MTKPFTRPLQTSATLDLGIDRAAGKSFQSQIARQMRELVLGGRLKPGEKLPSSRALSEDLKLARATVVEAYDQLIGEGYFETKVGSGTMVARYLPEDLLVSGNSKKAPKASPKSTNARRPAKPFRSGLVDWESFPHDAWGRILGRYWRNPPITLLEHNDPFGWMPLRKAIATHLFEWRGIACEAERVIITAGGSDAFDLIRRAAFKPGDALLLEEPGYPTARRVFAMGGVDVVPVDVDSEGLDVSRVRKFHATARGAFVTPARQYPTGVTMPLSRRLDLLNWAKDANALIIEDDYDSEYRYIGRPLPALMSLDRDANVIYSGTFSKVFSPIIRIGFIVIPERLVQSFRHERLVFGAPPSLVVQPALAQFIENGDFAVHIRRMRRLYASRREVLISSLSSAATPHFTIDAPPSGLMVLLRFNKAINDEAVAAELLKDGIETLPISPHFVGAKKQFGLILSFAGFSEKDLVVAAQRLLGLLPKLL